MTIKCRIKTRNYPMGIDMIRKWFGGKSKCFGMDFVVYEVRSGYVWWATGGFPRREKWSVVAEWPHRVVCRFDEVPWTLLFGGRSRDY